MAEFLYIKLVFIQPGHELRSDLYSLL